MTVGKLLERVSLRSPPEPAEALAELELLHFEQDLLRARLAEQEDLDQYLSHLQSALDAAAAEIVELKFNLRAEQQKCEQLTGPLEEARRSGEALRQSVQEREAQLLRIEEDSGRLREALAAATDENARLQQESGGLRAAGASAGEEREELAAVLQSTQDEQQRLADHLAAAETGRRAAQARTEAVTITCERLRAENEALQVERDTLELDLFGVLGKLGRYPQGALLRLTPGYRRLRSRYGNKLSGR